MSLIQPSDFWGKLEIAGANSEQGTREKVQAYIDEYTPKYFKAVFGDTLANLLINAMAVNEVVLTFTGDSAVIDNYYSNYCTAFGNMPRIIVDEMLSNGNRIRRNDVAISPTVVNGLTTQISLDFGNTGTYRVVLSKQLAAESEISFMSGSANPLVIDDWQDLYAAQYGNNPRADVYEVNGTTRILRSVIGMELIGDPLDRIEIDLGDSPQIEVILYGTPPVVTDRLSILLGNTDLLDGLKRYVYYYWHRDNVSFTTPMSQKKGQSQNSVDASVNQKLVDRWNEMVQYNWSVNRTLDRVNYPEYPVFTNYSYYRPYCLPEVYQPINTLGI